MKLLLNSFSIILIAISFTTITSCKKKDTTPATGTFYMHIHANIDTNEVDNNDTLYKDASGRRFSLSVANFYMSNISIHNVNGSTYTFSGAKILVSIDGEQYLVGQAPIGTYDYVTFDIGLDAATNALAPTGFTANGTASNTTMWYGSASQGYMFMKIHGMVDTAGPYVQPISYEIGSASNLRTVTLPTRGTGGYSSYSPYTLLSGGAQYVHVVCDYGALLSVVDFKTQRSTNSYTVNPSLATTIANNLSNFVRYEE